MGQRRYGDAFIEQALIMASVVGIRPAARHLSMPEGTLRRWTVTPPHSLRWAELIAAQAPRDRQEGPD